MKKEIVIASSRKEVKFEMVVTTDDEDGDDAELEEGKELIQW